MTGRVVSWDAAQRVPHSKHRTPMRGYVTAN